MIAIIDGDTFIFQNVFVNSENQMYQAYEKRRQC